MQHSRRRALDDKIAQKNSAVARTRPRYIVADIRAAYNVDELPLPGPNGPNGRRVLNLEMLRNHAFYWDWLNKRETEEALMEMYITRTRRAH